ncbi:MAG: hypothetical protein WBA93_34375 [Microcoleaceae cyanobacterium]
MIRYRTPDRIFANIKFFAQESGDGERHLQEKADATPRRRQSQAV